MVQFILQVVQTTVLQFQFRWRVFLAVLNAVDFLVLSISLAEYQSGPERCQTSHYSSESWCSDRRRVIDARPHLATGADVLLSLTPSTLSASSARPRRHETIGLRSRTVTPRLLQRNTCWSLSIDFGTVTACPVCGGTRPALPQATWPHQLCSARTTYRILCFLVHKASLGQSPDMSVMYHGHAPASRGHFIPVITAGRQSRRLRRPTDKSENGRIEHFPPPHRERGTSCWLNWKEHNRHLPFAEDWKRSFSTVHTAPNNTI